MGFSLSKKHQSLNNLFKSKTLYNNNDKMIFILTYLLKMPNKMSLGEFKSNQIKCLLS